MNTSHPENPRVLAYCNWQAERARQQHIRRICMSYVRQQHGRFGRDPYNALSNAAVVEEMMRVPGVRS